MISLTSVAYHTIYHTCYGVRLQKTGFPVLGGLFSGRGRDLDTEIDEGTESREGVGGLLGLGQGGEVGGREQPDGGAGAENSGGDGSVFERGGFDELHSSFVVRGVVAGEEGRDFGFDDGSL